METNEFITVLTFTYPQEMAIVRGRLESEGIECFVKDELTAQVHPFYSNAIGGVKQTIAILEEAGYLTNEDLQPPKEMVRLHKILSKIPVIKKLIK